MKKILIIEPNWLGDALFTTPAIRAIAKRSKGAYICVMTHKRCREILEGNPYIDEIITLKNGRGILGFFAKCMQIPNLRSKKIDMVFLFSRSMSYLLMCVLSKIPQRIAYKRAKTQFLTTKAIVPAEPEPHRVEYFLNLTRAVGIDTENPDYELFLTDKDEKDAQLILNANNIYGVKSYFVINPGGNWMPKRWPKEEFAKLADELFNKYNTKVVITGAKKDVTLGKEIQALSKTKPISICGKTTLKQMAAVLKCAKVVIANDSGPMHIAVSQKTMTVALFGPTHPEITGPYGNSKYIVVKKDVECVIPCYVGDCKTYHCMKDITVSDVMKGVENVLSKM